MERKALGRRNNNGQVLIKSSAEKAFFR